MGTQQNRKNLKPVRPLENVPIACDRPVLPIDALKHRHRLKHAIQLSLQIRNMRKIGVIIDLLRL